MDIEREVDRQTNIEKDEATDKGKEMGKETRHHCISGNVKFRGFYTRILHIYNIYTFVRARTRTCMCFRGFQKCFEACHVLSKTSLPLAI